ncbi:unnamed protein product, partial [Rotaria sp. Silwood1]
QQLNCKGPTCTKCQKCRDWNIKGGKDTWNWLQNWENWTDADQERWYRDNVLDLFTKRDGATCIGCFYNGGHYGGLYRSDLCFCEMH